MTLREHLVTLFVCFGLAVAAASCDASAPWVDLLRGDGGVPADASTAAP